MKMDHDWIRSTLGHGYLMCKDCSITIMEAMAIRGYQCKPIKKISEIGDKKDD